jgi:uncharacterized DUF497 family protein
VEVEVINDSVVLAWLKNEWDQTLEWDSGNSGKLVKHSVTLEQVESLFDSDFVVGGRIQPPEGMEWSEARFILYGKTSDGRYMTIVWTIRGSKIRPISCRSMRANEQKNYEEKIKQNYRK